MSKWNTKKNKSRAHAQKRKKTRGRSSGVFWKDTKPQLAMFEKGYANIYHLLFDLRKN